MRPNKCKWELTTRVLTTVLCLAAAQPAVAQRTNGGRGSKPAGVITLETRLPNFSVAGVSKLHALVQFSRQLRLPLGIECVRRSAFRPVSALSLTRPSVREVLESILGSKQGYVLRISDGVLEVNCTEVLNAKRNLFGDVVPRFSIPRSNLATASLNLWMSLELRLHPETEGFAGDYSPAPLGHDVGPLEMRGATVRQILNAIVASYGEAAWVATAPPSRLGHLPQSGLWAVIDYKDPRWADLIMAVRPRFNN